jgi:hypothetical protein
MSRIPVVHHVLLSRIARALLYYYTLGATVTKPLAGDEVVLQKLQVRAITVKASTYNFLRLLSLMDKSFSFDFAEKLAAITDGSW